MDLLTIVSITSLITTIIGLWFLGEKKAKGFIWFTVSLGCQIYLFSMPCHREGPNWFLVVQMIVLIVFNIYNFMKWTRGL